MKSFQMLRTVILFSVLLLTSLLTVNAQDDPIDSAESGLIGFCNDPEACNYISFEILIENSSENSQFSSGPGAEECIYPQWYIPMTDDTGLPAVLSCSPMKGFLLAGDQCCVAHVVSSDVYCINNDWDDACQISLDECMAAAAGSLGVEDCYDPAACNFNGYAFCSDNSGCEYAQWYIPSTPDLGEEEPNFPAIFVCVPPIGYVLAEECCLIQIILDDEFCVNTTWDDICQSNYDNCVSSGGTVTGCTDSSFCNYNPVACTDDNSCYGSSGCMNPMACNYDSSAICDNGLCELPGCSDPEANNYNPAAFCSLIYMCTYDNECPGDFDGDGFVNVTDLGGFLSAFGSQCVEQGGPF